MGDGGVLGGVVVQRLRIGCALSALVVWLLPVDARAPVGGFHDRPGVFSFRVHASRRGRDSLRFRSRLVDVESLGDLVAGYFEFHGYQPAERVLGHHGFHSPGAVPASSFGVDVGGCGAGVCLGHEGSETGKLPFLASLHASVGRVVLPRWSGFAFLLACCAGIGISGSFFLRRHV